MRTTKMVVITLDEYDEIQIRSDGRSFDVTRDPDANSNKGNLVIHGLGTYEDSRGEGDSDEDVSIFLV